ncbi:MAG: hypothetical protein AB7K71_02650 [Polyangiaceae bacterium]
MRLDLVSASTQLASGAQLLVISTSKDSNTVPDLGDQIVYAASDVKSSLGGAFQSLSARVAEYLVRALQPNELRVERARECVAQLVGKSARLERYDRRPSSDDEVRAFVRRHLSQERSGWSTLLRAWRAQGRACEQARFRELYREVSGK